MGIKSIPNTITLLNLFFGCLSVVSAFKGNLEAAALFIIIASVCDFFDGFLARILNAKSEFGKQLDSLADLISFGFAPSVIVYQLLCVSEKMPNITIYTFNPLPYIAFLIVLFSALRLAKFNIDLRQTDSFIGLPTPASALLFTALPLILWHYSNENTYLSFWSNAIISNFYFLTGLTIVVAFLLISELPLISFKFKTYNWHENYEKYIFLAISIILIVLFNFIAIPLIIVFYIILSLIIYFLSKKTIKNT